MSDRDLPAKLRIITSISRAINLHETVYRRNSRQSQSNENDFLRNFDIEFKSPNESKAIFIMEGMTPWPEWFLLFEEAEKVIMEDEYAFYGISYKTTVGSTLNRIKKHLEDFEQLLSNESCASQDQKEIRIQKYLYEINEFKEIQEALKLFNEKDEIEMEFVFTEWPSIEYSKKNNYVKDFELKIKTASESKKSKLVYPF